MNFISLHQLIDRILRNPIMKDLTFEKAVDDTVDFLEIVKVPTIFEDKYFETILNDYRCELPCDIAYIKQVLVNNIPAREATDTFHNHYHCMCIDNHPKLFTSSDYTIKIENGFLFSSVKCADIKISYKGIMTDEEGYPMIPDNRAFLNALEKFIESKYLRIQWQNGRVPDKVYEESRQEYMWSVGQAESAMRNLTLPKMESIFNVWRQLLVTNNHFSKRMNNLGARQNIKIHNNEAYSSGMFNFN